MALPVWAGRGLAHDLLRAGHDGARVVRALLPPHLQLAPGPPQVPR